MTEHAVSTQPYNDVKLMSGTKVHTCTKALQGPMGDGQRTFNAPDRPRRCERDPLGQALTGVGPQLYDVPTWLHEDGVGKCAAVGTDHAYGPLYRATGGRHVGFHRVNQHLPWFTHTEAVYRRRSHQVQVVQGLPRVLSGVAHENQYEPWRSRADVRNKMLVHGRIDESQNSPIPAS